MSDFRDLLGRGVGDFDPGPDQGLERTLDRARRRHRGRQVLAGVLAFGLFGATLAGAVALRDREARPIAGPTPTAAPSVETRTGPGLAPPPHPALGTDTCQGNPGPAQGDFCVKATSHVVVVGSGKTNGVAWALYAWTGTYRGPGPDPRQAYDEHPQPGVELPVLCTAWFFGEPRQPRCRGTADPDELWDRALVDMPGKQSGAIMEGSALPVGEFVIDPFFGPIRGLTAVWAWTPAETAGVVFEARDGRTFQAEVFGPAPELGNGLKWFVAFVPVGMGPFTARAEDQTGRELWHQQDPPIPTEPPTRPRYLPHSPPATVAEGTFEGGRWELLGYEATRVPGHRPALCLWFDFASEEGPGRTCTEPEGSTEGALGLDLDGDGPLPGIVYGYTPTATERVAISEEGAVSEASLYPAPEGFGRDALLFVGFTPREADVTIRAYDANGRLLWSDEHPYRPD
jgi:hypothetical protein